MRGHLWLGLVTLPLILFHAGFAMRGPLTFVLMLLFFAVYASGIFGAALQHYLPILMTTRVPLETIYEEIPHIRQQLRQEADDLVGTLESMEVEHDDKVRFRKPTSPPFVRSWKLPTAAGVALADDQRSVTVFESIRRAVPAELHPALGDLESICEEERQLNRQRRDVSLAARVVAGACAVVDCVAGVRRGARRHGAALLEWPDESEPPRNSPSALSWTISRNRFRFPIGSACLRMGLTGLGLLWLGWDALAGKQAYNAGPLSHAHKIVTNNCVSCHATPAFWGTKTSDVACVKCHDAPDPPGQADLHARMHHLPRGSSGNFPAGCNVGGFLHPVPLRSESERAATPASPRTSRAFRTAIPNSPPCAPAIRPTPAPSS